MFDVLLKVYRGDLTDLSSWARVSRPARVSGQLPWIPATMTNILASIMEERQGPPRWRVIQWSWCEFTLVSFMPTHAIRARQE